MSDVNAAQTDIHVASLNIHGNCPGWHVHWTDGTGRQHSIGKFWSHWGAERYAKRMRKRLLKNVRSLEIQ